MRAGEDGRRGKAHASLTIIAIIVDFACLSRCKCLEIHGSRHGIVAIAREQRLLEMNETISALYY